MKNRSNQNEALKNYAEAKEALANASAIYQEALQTRTKADQDASAIISEAEAKAEEIIANAKTKATEIINTADTEAKDVIEKASSTAEASQQKTSNHTIRQLAFILISLIVLVFIVLAIVKVANKPAYPEALELYEKSYGSHHRYIEAFYSDFDKVYTLVDLNHKWQITLATPEDIQNATWINQGTLSLKNGDTYTDLAIFTAKYLTVQDKCPDNEWGNIPIAIGYALFEKEENTYTEEQISCMKDAFATFMSEQIEN